MNGVARQAIVKIFPESLILDGLHEIAIGRRKDPNIGSNVFGRAHLAYFLFFQRTQELALHVQWQLSKLIQKECASLCHFEIAQLVFDGTRESALDVSEKQGLGQVLWNGGTIDGDEGSGCSGATHMDGAGDEFLTYTTFTRNHDTDGITGLDFFDSLAHGMTIIATGGFSTKNMSIGFFDSVSTEIVVMVFMVISSLPFILIFQSLRKGSGEIIQNSQVQFFLMFLTIMVVLVMFWLQKHYEVDYLQSLRIASFSVISIATGSGFSTYDFSLWGTFTTTLFLFVMMIGGCSGSSSCGLKIFRIQILLKSSTTLIKKIIQPRGIFIPTYNSTEIDEEILSSVTGYFFLYLLIFGFLTLVLSFDGQDLITALSGSAAALANVGPGLSEAIGPAGSYSSVNDLSKIFLCIGMLIGRLELFPLLILFSPQLWKR